jgi:hypothetical protein
VANASVTWRSSASVASSDIWLALELAFVFAFDREHGSTWARVRADQHRWCTHMLEAEKPGGASNGPTRRACAWRLDSDK